MSHCYFYYNGVFMEALSIIGLCAAAYVIGSIPFAQLFVSLFKKGTDLSATGTKENCGYNAWISAGPLAGTLTTIFALAKPGSVILLSYYWTGWNIKDDLFLIMLMCTVVLIGQMFSTFNSFKGSDGYSTAFGTFLFLSPAYAAVSALLFIPALLKKDAAERNRLVYLISLITVPFCGILFLAGSFIPWGIFGWNISALLSPSADTFVITAAFSLLWALGIFLRRTLMFDSCPLKREGAIKLIINKGLYNI